MTNDPHPPSSEHESASNETDSSAGNAKSGAVRAWRVLAVLLGVMAVIVTSAMWVRIEFHPLAAGGLVRWQRQQSGIFASTSGSDSANDSAVAHRCASHSDSTVSLERTGETTAVWYDSLFERSSYVVTLSCDAAGDPDRNLSPRSVSFWYRLDGKSRGADGKDLMGMFACTGSCAVPDGVWHLPNPRGEPVCELTWCMGQICSVMWIEH